MKLKIENIGFIAVLAAVFAFFYFILGFSGMTAALGIILFFIVPFYLILSNFSLEQDEKIIFSFFIGAGIFPSITYWIGMLVSFRISILIAFLLLLGAAYLIAKFRKKQYSQPQK